MELSERIAIYNRWIEAKCGNKRPYKKAWQAMAANKTHPNLRDLEPYHCHFCGFWHVGHKRR